MTLTSGGIYRCEVSNEFPDFNTVTRAEILSVVAIPSGPHILPRPPSSASPGDTLSLNCSLNGSLPVPRLQWYINKSPVTPTMLRVNNNSDTTINKYQNTS